MLILLGLEIMCNQVGGMSFLKDADKYLGVESLMSATCFQMVWQRVYACIYTERYTKSVLQKILSRWVYVFTCIFLPTFPWFEK